MFISLSTVPLCVFWLYDPRFGRCNSTLPDIFPLLQQTRQTTHCIGAPLGVQPRVAVHVQLLTPHNRAPPFLHRYFRKAMSSFKGLSKIFLLQFFMSQLP